MACSYQVEDINGIVELYIEFQYQPNCRVSERTRVQGLNLYLQAQGSKRARNLDVVKAKGCRCGSSQVFIFFSSAEDTPRDT
jgi:hypothetical protein